MYGDPAFEQSNSKGSRLKGTYCLIIHLLENRTIRVGALGTYKFPLGIYVYVGSAQGGIYQRVRRHASKKKHRRWHIDYLLSKARVISSLVIPCTTKQMECDVARTLLSSEGVSVIAKGFGSSDCDCDSHLVFFGDLDAEMVAETLCMRLSMLSTVYPRKR